MKRKHDDDLSAPTTDEDSWDDVECKVKLTMTLASETLAEINHLRKKKVIDEIAHEKEQQRITDSCIRDDERIIALEEYVKMLEKTLSDTRRWLADLTHHLQDTGQDYLIPCKCDSHVLKPYW